MLIKNATPVTVAPTGTGGDPTSPVPPTRTPLTEHPAEHAPGHLTERLTEVLFRDGPEGEGRRVHGHWRKAVSADLFRHRPDATAAERWQLAYDRLKLLNAELPLPAEELARDPRSLAALHEWTSLADGATATVAGIHYNLFLGSVVDDEVSPPRELGAFTSMARTGTFLCTERGHGNDAPALETTARYERERDEFVLHTPHEGAQKYMPNTSATGGPKTAVVAARLLVDDRDLGAFLFLTPLTDADGPLPGVTVTPLPERIGSPVDHCVTTFDRVRLPRTALIQGAHGQLLPDGSLSSSVGSARKRFLHAIGRVTVGKLCMSASTLGGCRAALTIAARYAYVRQVTGPTGGRVPIAAYRTHHARLVERVASAYAMTFLHRAVTKRFTESGGSGESGAGEREAVERLVAVAKGWITWQAREIVTEARERCGARALFPVNGLAEFAANADGAITAEGDNLAIWSKAGAEMIFGHELATAVPAATGAEEVTELPFLRGLLTTVERHWHVAARRDLRGGGSRRDGSAGGGSRDAFARWNNASGAALELVEAYATGQAADAFAAVCAEAEDARTRAVLEDLAALFLLRQVLPRSGLLVAEGALTVAQVRLLPEALGLLTDRLAPLLRTLTEAFDVPEAHVGALPMLMGV
ncbi:Acyl-CoA oxidase [Actinobacteria bacterium OK074]|nr:Acyl-CoA oxidase [Actinobacteria bacterium OK074]